MVRSATKWAVFVTAVFAWFFSTEASGGEHPPCTPELVAGYAPPGFNGQVFALTVFDDGSGPALYAGGDFTFASGTTVNRIAKWNGSAWTPLGTGLNAAVRAMTVFDAGDGPALYVGGAFTTAGGQTVNRIAKWNGTSWSSLGTGLNSTALALTTFDDGSGPALYAGGAFTTAGGASANRVARWNGSSWSSLGVGTSGIVHALAVFDDGKKAALHVGGAFGMAGGESSPNLARWDGGEWTAIESGMSTLTPVFSMTVFDDGTGEALYVGGEFVVAGPPDIHRIARFDGRTLTRLGSGLQGGTLPRVWSLSAFDDGDGPALFVGGTFTTAGGLSASSLAKWNGSEWSPLGNGLPGGTVQALHPFDDGSVPSLIIGGDFTFSAIEGSTTGLARWLGCVQIFNDCNGNGIDDAIDLLTGFSTDCNGDGIPDECMDGSRLSPVLQPFGDGVPLVYTFEDLSFVTQPVTVTLVVRADLDAFNEFVTLRIGDTTIATPFVVGGTGCGEGPDIFTISLPAAQFNGLLDEGTLTVEALPSPPVSTAKCPDSYVQIRLFFLEENDCNGNGIADLCDIGSGFSQDCNESGIPDECDIASGFSQDCNENGIPDECDILSGFSQDCDGNGIPDECDLAAGRLIDCNDNGIPDLCELLDDPSLDINGDGYLDECSYAIGDFNLDGVVDIGDLLVLLTLWGQMNPEIGDLNGDGIVDINDLLTLLANWGPYLP